MVGSPRACYDSPSFLLFMECDITEENEGTYLMIQKIDGYAGAEQEASRPFTTE